MPQDEMIPSADVNEQVVTSLQDTNNIPSSIPPPPLVLQSSDVLPAQSLSQLSAKG